MKFYSKSLNYIATRTERGSSDIKCFKIIFNIIYLKNQRLFSYYYNIDKNKFGSNVTLPKHLMNDIKSELAQIVKSVASK